MCGSSRAGVSERTLQLRSDSRGAEGQLNYYRRYVGDYGKKTRDLSILEHGVYGLLLDSYYSTEAPLPAAHERLYRICSAINEDEQRAVREIADKFFPIGPDGLRHNDRADEELATAIPEIEAARQNGKKGGRPRKAETQQKPKGLSEQNPTETQRVSQPEPNGVPIGVQPSTTIHQPSTPNPEKQKRTVQIGDRADSAGTFGAAALQGLKPDASPAGRIEGGNETRAGELAGILVANGLRGNAFHPLIVEWAREGITPERLKAAIAKARQRPGKETGVFGPEYLDPILHDETKPAAEVQAEKASANAARSLQKAQRQIAEQRVAAERAAPMPEHLRPQKAGS